MHACMLQWRRSLLAALLFLLVPTTGRTGGYNELGKMDAGIILQIISQTSQEPGQVGHNKRA